MPGTTPRTFRVTVKRVVNSILTSSSRSGRSLEGTLRPWANSANMEVSSSLEIPRISAAAACLTSTPNCAGEALPPNPTSVSRGQPLSTSSKLKPLATRPDSLSGEITVSTVTAPLCLATVVRR